MNLSLVKYLVLFSQKLIMPQLRTHLKSHKPILSNEKCLF